MTTKEYLSQLKNIDNRIKDLLKEADRWFDIATSNGSIDYAQDKVQTSPNPDRIGDLVGKVVDYQERCKRLANEKIELKHKITEQIRGIHGIEGELYYNLLYGYYVDRKDFNKLAVENGYSYRQIRNKYNKALDEFKKMYGTQYVDVMENES